MSNPARSGGGDLRVEHALPFSIIAAALSLLACASSSAAAEPTAHATAPPSEPRHEPTQPSPREQDDSDAVESERTPDKDPTPPRAACSGWRSEKGRRPREPMKHCAGPAVDAHTKERNRDALGQVQTAISSWLMPIERRIPVILDISDACEDQCGPEVQAKLWMYAGIVFGSGKNDLTSAQCAFEVALAWDPKVALDEQIATDATKAAFAMVRGDVCGE